MDPFEHFKILEAQASATEAESLAAWAAFDRMPASSDRSVAKWHCEVADEAASWAAEELNWFLANI